MSSFWEERAMKMRLSMHLFALACALALPGLAWSADAVSSYPVRPIRVIVPNAPGSSVDTLNRILVAKLSATLGQQIISDNRAGASGVIGMEIVKGALPDGYTLLSASTAASTIAVQLMKKPTFNPVTDYEQVVEFAVTPNVLVVNPALPIKTVRELIDYTKSKNGQVNMASAGNGSQSHLSGVYLMQYAKFESLHVPYNGGGPSVASVVSGESQWTLTPAAAVMTLVKSGRLRALGHSLPKRSALLGDIPPIAETVPGFDYSGWQGLMAPKGTPKAIVEKIRLAVIKTTRQPEVKDLFAAQGTEIVTGTSADFRKLVVDSMAQNALVVKAVGLKAE
jgi:tripartite-type tricarboxylate transporter receptor subunit TctC